MKLSTSILFTLLTINMAFSGTKDLAVWGRMVKSEGKIANYKYFVVYTKEGKHFGYPLDLGKYESKKAKSFVNKFVRIEGKISTNEVKFESQTKKITVVFAKKIKMMNLSDLSIGKYTPDPKLQKKKSKTLKKHGVKPSRDGAVEVGFEVGDDVANATIFTGAALLIGSILLDK